jgi:hypothetical protein
VKSWDLHPGKGDIGTSAGEGGAECSPCCRSIIAFGKRVFKVVTDEISRWLPNLTIACLHACTPSCASSVEDETSTLLIKHALDDTEEIMSLCVALVITWSSSYSTTFFSLSISACLACESD